MLTTEGHQKKKLLYVVQFFFERKMSVVRAVWDYMKVCDIQQEVGCLFNKYNLHRLFDRQIREEVSESYNIYERKDKLDSS